MSDLPTDKPLAFAVLLLAIAACSGKIPDEYAALGIPPNPDRVAKIEKDDAGDETTYRILYATAFSAEDFMKTNMRIAEAGYKADERGNGFSGPRGAFVFSCSKDGYAPGEGPTCVLRVPEK
jgi:hypothetical protein